MAATLLLSFFAIAVACAVTCAVLLLALSFIAPRSQASVALRRWAAWIAAVPVRFPGAIVGLAFWGLMALFVILTFAYA